jgi:hypothetical protein
MKKHLFAAAMTIVLGLTGVAGTESSALATGNQAFGFNAPLVDGFSGGRAVEITGGGVYSLPEFVHSGGGFRCLSDIEGGPFNGCKTGQGVRWDTAMLLTAPPNGFKCTGAASEILKTVPTGDKTVVLLADFYRQGDGDDESFTAQMIVSESDLDTVAPGIQNVWVQGVGCGTAVVNFN